MHLHGHNFFLLAEGNNTYVEGKGKLNLANPQRRDTQLVQPNGWMVVQYDTDTPGIWPFHCHIAWQVSQGLYVGLMEHPGQIKQVTLPQLVHDTCKAWNDWTSDHVVNQIDSGLRAMDKRA